MSIEPRCLFTVSDTFFIKGHGIVLIPGIRPQGDERFRVGDDIDLHLPDGTIFGTKIAGIEMFSPPPRDGSFPILLKDLKRKEDVPIGTEVWSTATTFKGAR